MTRHLIYNKMCRSLTAREDGLRCVPVDIISLQERQEERGAHVAGTITNRLVHVVALFKASSARFLFPLMTVLLLARCGGDVQSANPFAVQQFSATMVTTVPGVGDVTSKIYKSSDKLRQDMPKMPEIPGMPPGMKLPPQPTGYTLTLLKEDTVYQVMGGQCTQITVAGGPQTNPFATTGEVTRKELGTELVDGHPTKITQISITKDGHNLVEKAWLATDLHDFPLRLERSLTRITFKDVSLSDPPASLFEKPTSCTKTEIPQDVQRKAREMSQRLTDGYLTLDAPQPTESPGKIEVIEFFSYDSINSELYPLLSRWAAKLPPDVVFRRVAVGRTAGAYYALEATGDLEKLEGALFQTINDDHQQLGRPTQLDSGTKLIDWVGAHGSDAGRFKAAYRSAEVQAKLNQAGAMFDRYQTNGSPVSLTPAIVVDGKYLVLGLSSEDLIKHTDQLISKVRAESRATATRSRP
jgi:protein dithiol oxidoreductase (disulfide-forming)